VRDQLSILIVQRLSLSSVSCARRVLCQSLELAQRGHYVNLMDFPHAEREARYVSLQDISMEGIRVVPLSRRAVDIATNCLTIKKLDPPPDIVHLWKSYPDAALPAIFAADRWGVPLHYDWDDWEPSIARELTGSRLAGHLAGLWDRSILKVSETCSVASQRLKEFALDWGMPEERIWDAPVGADTALFTPRAPDPEILERLGGPNVPILVYVGQLEVATYVETAVEVLARLQQRGSSARLLVVGGGRYEGRVKDMAKDSGLSDNVTCTGYVPGDEVPRWLSVGSVALAPFLDTLVAKCKSPLKIAEYLAMGLPIVASDVGDARTMVEEAGLLCPPGDIEAMADCVDELLTNAKLRDSFRIAARAKAEERYNWSRHVDQLECAYRAALS